MKNRTFLFIDGSNLYAGQYELFGPDSYVNFSKFISIIEDKLKTSFDKIYFYTSYSPVPKKPTRKQKLYLKNEAFFYRSVKQTKNIIFFTGYRSKTSGKEKEVDVKLAVDIVDFAHRNMYNQMYLMSGDADFMEALFTIRRLYKKIEVLCLENKIMFRSFAFFDTNLVIFKQTPYFVKLTRTMTKNVRILKIQKEEVVRAL